jgi:drug/metabolite transporter (DMT)-like permease
MGEADVFLLRGESYFTHGSWAVLWPFQLLVLKARKPNIPWKPFLKAHYSSVLTTARMIMAGSPHLSPAEAKLDPVPFMLRRIVSITCALTIAGSTWYVAVNMTTPSDLTAIYNCSAFFAYVFSIFMLKERMRADKIFSVVVACVGVLIVAYGDQGGVKKGEEEAAANRTLGNLIIGVGSVMYGFYEVLYKKAACPPEGISSSRSIIFANAVGTGLGVTTLVTPPPFPLPSLLC